MTTNINETIRRAVRDNYGKIAKRDTTATDMIAPESCCSKPETGLEQLSTAIGYSQEDLSAIPDGANLGLGCGNPVALGAIKPGETVIDLGCGAGFDSFLAAKKAGREGRVIGIDMTPAMVSKARRNAEKMKSDNVDFRLGEIEDLPVADNTADVIISNCVINLSPEKGKVFREAYRVLKPGGRIAISDMLAAAALPEDVKNDLSLFSACISGAATVEKTTALLEEAGFENIKIDVREESKKRIDEFLPCLNAGDYIIAAYIEAEKPRR